jgi:exopolysaccharide biosynthesis polyprenyl glycosylphosphotransferase
VDADRALEASRARAEAYDSPAGRSAEVRLGKRVGEQTFSSQTTSAEPTQPDGEPRALGAARPRLALGRDIRARTPYLVVLLARSESYRKLARVGSLLLIDLLGLAAAIFSALALEGLLAGGPGAGAAFERTIDYLPLAYLVTVLIFAKVDLYGSREHRPGPARTVAALCQAAVLGLIFVLVSGGIGSYWVFAAGLPLAALYVTGLRHLYDDLTGRLLRSLGFRRRALLVGTEKRVGAVASLLDDEAGAFEIVGCIALDRRTDGAVRDLGTIDDLPERLWQHAIEEVVIADPDFPEDRAVELIGLCQARGVRVRVAPSTMKVLTGDAELVPGQGIPLFEVKPPVFEGFDFAIKRSFDFAIAGVGVIVLAPALALIGVLIKLTSRGPVLHRGLRPGIGGRPFRCLKFRTMYEDAEVRQPELEHLNEATGAIFKIRKDPRMTPVGRFLRRNSLDELPQLFNVLRGEMSLVGPRPLPLRDHARLESWHRRRYLVLPGITGPWQVSDRSNLDFDDMVRLDFLYLERWSVLLDLVILFKTLPAVIRRRGAH